MSEPMSELPALPPLGDGVHLNVGTDLEDVARFDDDRTRTDVLFSEAELAHAANGGGAAALAGTWCVKEATVKALWPWVRLDPRRVLVSREADGRPTATVVGHDLSADGVQVQVSITHTSTVASAVAVAWGPMPAATTEGESHA